MFTQKLVFFFFYFFKEEKKRGLRAPSSSKVNEETKNPISSARWKRTQLFDISYTLVLLLVFVFVCFSLSLLNRAPSPWRDEKIFNEKATRDERRRAGLSERELRPSFPS